MALRLGIAAGVVWVLALGLCGLHHAATHPGQVAQPALASVSEELGVHADHAYLGDGSSHACPDQFATVVLPRSATALAALGVVMAVAAVTGWLAPLIVSAGPGPPGRSANVLTGHDLLTRFCLARR
ncbi:hypothetical protein AWC14_19310 [Mycobacterium kyorinense]|uniref:Lipoprotein LpqS n=1 Tax=Mycobacterium kyorinense TaxID=487514 RepID=A0A1X1YIY0_9MYCO|nr:hypothetical protein AWC14_19310 [Mycobacterium kyorinense]